MRSYATRTTILGALVALTLLSACGRPFIEYVDENRSYTAEEVLAMPDKLDPLELAEEPSSESKRLRHQALVDLRKQGGAANEAAELITKTFSAETVGVPFYVERAKFGSTTVFVMVEAIGPASGALQDERVWVLDAEQGEVLLSGTR